MTVTTPPLVEEFERDLGDPREATGVFSYARCNALDRAEAFPEEIIELIDGHGLNRHYVPEEFGGALDGFPTVLGLLRAVARRDLTVAVAHSKTFLGVVGGWVAPTTPATHTLARQALDGYAISCGMTERAHGSDLVASEVMAKEVPGGFELTGEKWLINNATRSRTMSVLARTGEGPRGLDVILVDKTTLRPGSFRSLPKVRTHGIRSADISGLVLDGAFVPTQARVGRPHTGLETMLKGLQLTRTLCGALSLGAGEHALRLALEDADRPRFGRPLAEQPDAVRTLADACADHLLSEAVALVGCRGVHAFGEETSVVAAVVKYLLPSRTDRMIDELGRWLGLRSQLVDADGRFQKVARDHRVIHFFDGNTLVNLNMLINEFPAVARHAGTAYDTDALHTAFDPGRALPPFRMRSVRLATRSGSTLLRALPDLVDAAAGTPTGPAAARLLDHHRRLLAELADHRFPGVKVPRHVYAQAERLALCWAGAAVLGLAAHAEPEGGDPLWTDGLWARVALGRVLAALGEPTPRSAGQDRDLVGALLDRLHDGRSLSVLPHRVAEGVNR